MKTYSQNKKVIFIIVSLFFLSFISVSNVFAKSAYEYAYFMDNVSNIKPKAYLYYDEESQSIITLYEEKDLENYDEFIIYDGIWNESLGNVGGYDYYALDINGNAVPVTMSGDKIYYMRPNDTSVDYPTPSIDSIPAEDLLWELLVFLDKNEYDSDNPENNVENGYYVLQSVEGNKSVFTTNHTGDSFSILQKKQINHYFAPASDGFISVSETPSSILLPGREKGNYSTAIEMDNPDGNYGISLNEGQDGVYVTAERNGSESFKIAKRNNTIDKSDFIKMDCVAWANNCPSTTHYLEPVKTVNDPNLHISLYDFPIEDWRIGPVFYNMNRNPNGDWDTFGNWWRPYDATLNMVGRTLINEKGDFDPENGWPDTFGLKCIYDGPDCVPGPDGIYDNFNLRELFTDNKYFDPAKEEYSIYYPYDDNLSGTKVAEDVTGMFLDEVYQATGYYYYNAGENSVWYNKETNHLDVYRQLVDRSLGEYNADSHIDGEYFPLNNPKNFEAIFWNKRNLEPDAPRFEEDIYYNKNDINYHFGTVLDGKFLYTIDGKDDFGNDLTFEFTGDDDFWVYVDGVLMLDLGGIHEPLTGSINFQTGVIKSNVDPETPNLLNLVKYGVDVQDYPHHYKEGNVIAYLTYVNVGTEENPDWQLEKKTCNPDDPGLSFLEKRACSAGEETTTIFKQFEAAGILPDGTVWPDKDDPQYTETLDQFFKWDDAGEEYTTFKDMTTHFFKVIQMDRGGNESHLKFKFNLPFIR